MKALKILLIAIFGLLGLLLLIAAFLPDEYRVERSTVINAPPETVFEYVADFGHWSSWSPWQPLDPDAEITITAPGKGAGAVMTWDGEIMGKGNLTYTDVNPPHEVRSKLVFTDPYEMTSTDVWTFEAVGEGTKITWSDEGTLSWPLERWIGLTLDNQLGKDFERGLNNIKQLVENLSAESPDDTLTGSP
jgi:uncharacterized protein YndB with AHSA1/START domain